ncbi:hypothetical protein D3C73_1262410 [compost metagenome]
MTKRASWARPPHWPLSSHNHGFSPLDRYSCHRRSSSWLRAALRFSGPSNTGGVGCETSACTTPAGVFTGTTQCDFDDSRSCDQTPSL